MIRTAMIALGLSAGMLQGLAAQVDDDAWQRRCERGDYDDRVRHCEVRVTEFRPEAGALAFLPGQNGGVSIRGWDRANVEVHTRIQIRADGDAEARSLARDIRITRSGNRVGTDGPEVSRRTNWSIEFVVYVPNHSDLHLQTENGPLSVRGVNGRMDLATINGPLSLQDVGGDVIAKTSNGPLHVELTGRRWDGKGLDATTSNGPATIVIPENFSAELETGTTNGPMQSDFPLTVTMRGRFRSSTIRTTLGSGGPPVRVVTTNGPLSLRRP